MDERVGTSIANGDEFADRLETKEVGTVWLAGEESLSSVGGAWLNK